LEEVFFNYHREKKLEVGIENYKLNFIREAFATWVKGKGNSYTPSPSSSEYLAEKL
jgi:hypothetical protein